MIVRVKRPLGEVYTNVEARSMDELVDMIQKKWVCASIASTFQLCMNGAVVLQVKHKNVQDIAWKKVNEFSELILLVEHEMVPIQSYFSQKLRKCQSSAAVLEAPTLIHMKKRKTHYDNILLSAQGLIREYPNVSPKVIL